MGKQSHRSAEPSEDVWKTWKTLVNMTPAELRRFMESEEGQVAGLSRSEARSQGISSGRESAEWLLKMIPLGKTYRAAERNWTPEMWRWARAQVSFNMRMLGSRGPLYRDGKRTRKYLSLLIWGCDPMKGAQ